MYLNLPLPTGGTPDVMGWKIFVYGLIMTFVGVISLYIGIKKPTKFWTINSSFILKLMGVVSTFAGIYTIYKFLEWYFG